MAGDPWVDLAYDMWALLQNSQAIEAQDDWEREKKRIGDKLKSIVNGPRMWPRLSSPPRDVRRVVSASGTMWVRASSHYWKSPGYEQGVTWAQVLHWGPVTEDLSYSPVRVPENTGKHPGDSSETGTNTDIRCREPGCPDYGDPDFGEGTCPAEHADLKEESP